MRLCQRRKGHIRVQFGIRLEGKCNKEVGVINFSSETLKFDFSTDFKKICENLILYQGGNTNLDVNVFNELLNNNDLIFRIKENMRILSKKYCWEVEEKKLIDIFINIQCIYIEW